MPPIVLSAHDRLLPVGRIGVLTQPGQRATAVELLTLLAAGAGAAWAVTMLDFSLKLPGHAILRALLPLACGVSLVPRCGAGMVMAAGAAATVGGMSWRGAEISAGSTTSLLVLGPLLDLALLGARPGWTLYLRMMLAGLGANLLALASRASAPLWGGKPMKQPLGFSLASYVAWGIVAGLVAAAIWFRWSPRRDSSSASPTVTP